MKSLEMHYFNRLVFVSGKNMFMFSAPSRCQKPGGDADKVKLPFLSPTVRNVV